MSEPFTVAGEDDFGPSFLASFPGDCEGCGDAFETGDLIKMRDGDPWHADCTEDNNGAYTAKRPCPNCHLVPSRSGVCGCDV